MKISDLLNPVQDPLGQGPPGRSTKQSLNRHKVARPNVFRGIDQPLDSPRFSNPMNTMDVVVNSTEVADEGNELQPPFSVPSCDWPGGSSQASRYDIDCQARPSSLAHQRDLTAIQAEVVGHTNQQVDADHLPTLAIIRVSTGTPLPRVRPAGWSYVGHLSGNSCVSFLRLPRSPN